MCPLILKVCAASDARAAGLSRAWPMPPSKVAAGAARSAARSAPSRGGSDGGDEMNREQEER